jgi:hypothetical protein
MTIVLPLHPPRLAREKRVAPWDLAVVLMHARAAALFGGR